MTLDTRIYVQGQVDHRALFLKCNQLIKAHEHVKSSDDGRCISNQRMTTNDACHFCRKVLSIWAGFIHTVKTTHIDGAGYPAGEKQYFCSAECLRWQLHEDEKS